MATREQILFFAPGGPLGRLRTSVRPRVCPVPELRFEIVLLSRYLQVANNGYLREFLPGCS